MVSYSLASVVDTGGDVLEIIDVVPNTTVMMEPGVQYLKLSAMAAEKIESNLSSGKRCAVAKGLQTEITPNDILVREAQSDVEFTTVTYRSKIHDLFTNSLLVGNAADFNTDANVHHFVPVKDQEAWQDQGRSPQNA